LKIFKATNITHMICRNKNGRIFSAALQESRVYKSPDSVYGNILRQNALIRGINIMYHQRNDNNDKHYNIQETVGYHLGRGWILSDKQN